MENLLVYHVDIGRWITFDCSLLDKTVLELKLQIKKKTDISISKQVLLISGGGQLDASKIVSCYCAGTDTSPFFLFSKSLIDHSEPPSVFFDTRPDVDLAREHHTTQGMPPTIEALNVKLSLAQQFSVNAQYNLSCIEILINDHHMMHQGWLAAVANMFDTIEKFKSKAKIFEDDYKCYLDKQKDNINLLKNFNDILSEISKIPMLPALFENSSKEQAQIVDSSDNVKNMVHESLLDWVTVCHGLTNLEQIVEHCENSLKQFDDEMLNAVLQEVFAMNECAYRNDSIDIKGLEHRLFKLNQMMDETKQLVAEQNNIAEAIKMNHERATNEGDLSVISLLLTSHDKQLEMMNTNSLRLRDIRDRCILAKQELCNNIHPRLKWLIVIENKVSDIEAIMLLYSDSIKLTREYLNVVEQLKNTPKLYFNAVAEVVRRRIYSQAFLIWSSDLACRMMIHYSDEIAKRKHFQSQFEGHFLSQLFPGFEDLPPAYATQAPPIFDYNLPKLCLEDLDTLIKQLPQVACDVSLPNLNSITQFFLSKSIQNDNTLAIESNDEYKSRAMETDSEVLVDIEKIEEKLNEVMRAVGIGSFNTDMEEKSDMVKRTHSEMENDSYNLYSCILPHKHSGSDQHNVCLLKNSLSQLKNSTNTSINTLRSDLNTFKQFILQQNLEMNIFISDLQLKYDLQTSYLCHLIQLIEESNFELNRMRIQISELESLVEIHKNKEEHERQLRFELENDRDQCLQRELELVRKEITNKLTMTHKKKLEMLQVRFKIVTRTTNIERSSSEQHLEKNKRYNVIELVNHEAMMAQLKEDLLIEKEQAIQEERRKYEDLIASERQKHDDQYFWEDGMKNTVDKESYSKYLKEKNINEFRLRLGSCDKNSSQSSLVLPKGDDIISSSTSSCIFMDLNKSSSSENDEGKLSVTSFNVGDSVLVIWNSTYKNYVIYQENKKYLVFLHPSSIENLSLKIDSDETSRLQNFSAEIIHKEYCQALKEDNRYNVKKGMKFYRVKVQLPKEIKHTQEILYSDSLSVSLTYI